METRGTVLVVDDDPAIAGVIGEVLGDEGYRVLVAATLAVALDILAAFRVQLVITDAFRPGPGAADDLWARLDPLARAAGGAPIILCSAHKAGDYADLTDHGFAAYLAKPFDLDDLLATVRAALLGDGRPRPGVGDVPGLAGGSGQR